MNLHALSHALCLVAVPFLNLPPKTLRSVIIFCSRYLVETLLEANDPVNPTCQLLRVGSVTAGGWRMGGK